MIRLCHTISLIITPGSRPLICQLSSPTSISKKAQSTKRHLNCCPSKYKERYDFSSQRRDQTTPLLSLELGEGRGGGSICSDWILICTRIATRVPPHQDRSKQMTRHASRAPSRAPLNRSWGHSFRGHHCPENCHAPSTSRAPLSCSRGHSSRSKQDSYNNQPRWFSNSN